MRVLIVGVRKEHSDIIKRRYPHINFKIAHDQIKNHEQISVKDFDRIYIMKRFTNHGFTDKVRKHNHRVFVPGSYSNLQATLDKGLYS